MNKNTAESLIKVLEHLEMLTFWKEEFETAEACKKAIEAIRSDETII